MNLPECRHKKEKQECQACQLEKEYKMYWS